LKTFIKVLGIFWINWGHS